MQSKHIRIHKAIADKIKIVNYANQNSIHMAADKYGVERKSIRNLKKKQLQKLLKMSDKSIKSTLHHGGKQKWWSRKWNSWLDTNQ